MGLHHVHVYMLDLHRCTGSIPRRGMVLCIRTWQSLPTVDAVRGGIPSGHLSILVRVQNPSYRVRRVDAVQHRHRSDPLHDGRTTQVPWNQSAGCWKCPRVDILILPELCSHARTEQHESDRHTAIQLPEGVRSAGKLYDKYRLQL
uniref:(northern house mosquito) hypothetical protein n=1 Tax=Culex pipiens TaxID=7175 RepID=A0A8D8HJI7_CULPI